MTTCRDIITYGLRQAKVIAPGSDPDTDEADDGMVALQSLYDMWVASGVFGRMTDRYETANYEAKEGERVIAPAGITVTFPTTVEADEGDRAPRDLSIVETIVDTTRSLKIYDRTAWVSLLALTLSDTAPLATRGVAGLSACLAETYSEMFGGTIGPATRMMAQQFKMGLCYKLGSTRDRVQSEYS